MKKFGVLKEESRQTQMLLDPGAEICALLSVYSLNIQFILIVVVDRVWQTLGIKTNF